MGGSGGPPAPPAGHDPRGSARGPKRPSSKGKQQVDLTGVTLKEMLESLEQSIGFDGLFAGTGLKSFQYKPFIPSSLKVLRQPDMEWARKKVEYMYIKSLKR